MMNSNSTYPRNPNTTNTPTARKKRLRTLPTKRRIAQGTRKKMNMKFPPSTFTMIPLSPSIADHGRHCCLEALSPIIYQAHVVTRQQARALSDMNVCLRKRERQQKVELRQLFRFSGSQIFTHPGPPTPAEMPAWCCPVSLLCE